MLLGTAKLAAVKLVLMLLNGNESPVWLATFAATTLAYRYKNTIRLNVIAPNGIFV